MRVFDWYDLHKETTLLAKNCHPKHEELFEIFERTWDQEDAAERLATYQRSHDLALEIGDELFALFCVPQISRELTELCQLEQDYQMLVKAVVKAREPQFDGTPQQIMVNVLLLGSMVEIDPFGYQSQIEKIKQHLDSICVGVPEHACVYEGTMFEFYLGMKNLEQARLALDRQRIATDEDGCDISDWNNRMDEALLSLEYEQWERMLDFADQSLEFADDKPSFWGKSYLARAIALTKLGRLEEAKNAYRESLVRSPQSKSPRHIQLSVRYWINWEDTAKAIDCLRNGLNQADASMLSWDRIQLATQLCELLVQTDQREEASRWAELARQWCQNLKNPAPQLEELDSLLAR